MLRCSTELIRYDVEGSDGTIGKVRDFYFDDRSWIIRFIVVDTDGLLGDNRILVQPQDVRELRFPQESIVLKMSQKDAEEGNGRAMFPASATEVEGADAAAAGDLMGNGLVLRSVEQIGSFEVNCKDAKIGYVHGLLIETTTWSIRYVIVDTGHWMPGKLVLLSPLSIEGIDWDDQIIKTDVTEDGVKNCPPYDIKSETSREYEAFLHDYYGWKKYWS